MRERQAVKILDEAANRALAHGTIVQVCDPRDFMPVLARAETTDEVNQRELSFVAHDTVELRQFSQRVFVTQARVMTAHREMTPDSGLPQMRRDAAKLRQEELKDQREADDGRPRPRHDVSDTVRAVPDLT